MRSESSRLDLPLGPYAKRITVTPTTTDPISFEHHQTRPDSVALLVEVRPAAVITFGQGEPPDRPPMNIDEGRTRAAGGTFPATSDPGKTRTAATLAAACLSMNPTARPALSSSSIAARALRVKPSNSLNAVLGNDHLGSN